MNSKRLSYLSGAIRGLISPIRTVVPPDAEFEHLDSIRTSRKFVFVTGMHRSGTTYVAQELSRIEGVSGFDGIPGRMNEGQFVQRVYPIDAEFGGMAYFGYHPRSRMKERGLGKSRKVGICLLKDWLVYLDSSKPVFLEKTPSNFRRCRLLASAFPNSSFIHVVRHPFATCLALQAFAPESPGIKGQTFSSLVRHWTRCQQQALADLSYLRSRGHGVVVITLEDLPVFMPRLLGVLQNWIGMPVGETEFAQEPQNNVNEKYQIKFDQLLDSEKTISSATSSLLEHFGYKPDLLTEPPQYGTWLESEEKVTPQRYDHPT